MRTITLCGSTRFKDEYLAMLETLTLMGWIVLLPGYFGHHSVIPITTSVKDSLVDLQHKRIAMSDAIFVINKDGYIGDSTKDDIRYAQSLDKIIYYLEENN